MIDVRVMRLANAKLPSYAHEGDAGMDLFAAEGCILQPMERKLISTGIKIALPHGYEAQIRPKSGLALNHGISIVNTPGTIDAGYRGIVQVLCINFDKESYEIKVGQKIAQMIIQKAEQANLVEVKELENTKRGEGGYGSTGVH